MIDKKYAGTHLVSGTFGDQQAAFASALVGLDEGFSLDEAVIRVTAIGAPYWNRKVQKSDFSFMVRTPSTPRSKRRGTVHAFAHKAEKGAKETCTASGSDKHGECKATTKSKGDSVTRWRTDNDENGNVDTRMAELSVAQVAKMAVANMTSAIDFLKDKGHTLQEMQDTPGLVQRVNIIANVTKQETDAVWAVIFGEAKRASKPAAVKKTTRAPRKAAAKKSAKATSKS